MPEAYVIAAMHVSDPEQYSVYLASAPATVAAAGGTYLARGGRHETLEGAWQPHRVGVLRFPSYEQAKAWYDGEQYRRAREHRAGTTEYFHMILVEGVEAPAPATIEKGNP